MKQTILLIIGLFLVFPVFAQYTVRGGTGAPLLAETDTRNKIQVYLLNGLSGAEISFTSDSGTHQWYKYQTRPSEAVAIPCQQTGNTSTITDISDGFGYFVGLNKPDPFPEDPNSTSYIWIIDYSKPNILSLSVQEREDQCEYLRLTAHVEAKPLQYHSYSGATISLQRTYHLLFSNLKWDEVALAFVPKAEDLPQTGIISEIVIDPPPLKNTIFTLAGDDYANHFGLEQRVTTPEYEAVALEVHATMTALKEENENEQSAGSGETDFSAPVEIKFTAYANDVAARYMRWKIMKINEKDSVTVAQDEKESLIHSFKESGNYVAQLEVDDRHCFDNSQVFNLFIGDSDLRLPNAFSPGSSIGVNDEYRVSYKSLVSFKASIYNRWGNLLFHWEDPAQGWDGKAGGRYVPTGVYFIVVEAKGADGKTYTRSSDINVLRSKN
ncbi:hypothetical protein FACS189428_2760 [Clostridia bacterium]|nr:hypothetical protein FACS189428_2760 [Clostridia bacterium]